MLSLETVVNGKRILKDYSNNISIDLSAYALKNNLNLNFVSSACHYF